MGTLPDWITAFTALGALYFAWKANKASSSMLSLENQREHKRDEREIAEQASDVSAWCAVHLHGEERNDCLLIHNSSKLPVYELAVESTDSHGMPARTLNLAVLPPGDFLAFPDPRYGWTFPDPVASCRGLVRPITKTDKWSVTSVTMRDAVGTRWRRTQQGRLSQVTESAPSPQG